jgi:ParB-like chromosome segregation protein Spo0J
MPRTVKAAFRPDVISLQLDCLVPTRVIDPRERHNAKYKQIAISLSVVGLIEPIVVFASRQGKYRVLDGHKRLDILIQRKSAEVECLLATDNEAYTYNKRVNYLSPVVNIR